MKVSVEKSSASALDLMGRVLRSQGSIASEYPLIFREDLPGRLVTLSAGGAVRSACAILERELVIGALRVRAGLIGSVSTDPAWRGRGFASRVLKAAEAELAAQGCLLALLWADEPGFYQEHGYQEIGAEIDYVIPSELARDLPDPLGARAGTTGDAAAIHALYTGHAERVERSAQETQAMLQTPGMELFVLERGGRPAAYTCLGRGADLRDVVHEWGGELADVLRLVRAHIEQRLARGDDSDLFLMAPLSASKAPNALDQLGAPSVRGILGQGKLLDPNAARDALARLVPDASCALEHRPSGAVFRLRGPRGTAELDVQQVLALLFAPRGGRSEIHLLEQALGVSLDALPLHPFVWGLDSI